MKKFNFKLSDALPLIGGALLIGSKIIEHKVDEDKKAKYEEDLFKKFSERIASQKQD